MKISILLPGFIVSLLLLVPWGAALPADKQPPARTQPAADSPSDVPPLAPFPTAGILPKEEIGALRFLKQNPQCDGRGVVVAIFDSGVDLGVVGLERTTDGKPKIIDVIDGTGSGDVDTSATREPKGNQLEGLSGRQLKLNPAWVKPGRKFHVGLKRGYDLFTDDLISRLKSERRKGFEKSQRTVETGLRRQLADWDTQHPKPSAEQKLRREDLEARLRVLRAADGRYDDPGPVYDCVVFHDGRAWQAAVDTDEDGDLAEEKLLTDYRDCLQYAALGQNSQVNFGVNIYDDGRTLSIVTDSSPHATHVAGIVAGHFPGRPELSGVAPGAQIVSVKIGDSRLGSMETGAGFVRGLSCVLRNKCDLVNMSYGEPTTRPNAGRLLELLSELVDRHGVIFVSSAGNAGPALSTVGAPGGTASALIGVGAYISPAMMRAEYAIRRALPDMPYTWTSRGPTYDGDFGVDLFAPGGAISTVPTWMLQRQMLMNGTSMASPNCCGGIALMLSALKTKKVPYSPYSVRRALENTAQPVGGGDPLSQGAGLIQIDRACEYLVRNAAAAGERLRFDIDVTDREHARGIYLREPHETCRPLTARVRVKPAFREEAPAQAKLDFEMRAALQCTQPWVEAGEYLVLTQEGKTFEMRVDPRKLPPGVHVAEIRGYDAAAPQRGPIFRVPITVTMPEAPAGDTCKLPGKAELRHGDMVRRFVAVPSGATRMDLRLRLAGDDPRKFMLHVLQRRADVAFRHTEQREMLTVQPAVELARSVAVSPGTTLEFCLAPYWSNVEDRTAVEYELSFHGLVPDCREVTLTADEPAARVEVSSPLRRETLSPVAKLDMHRTLIAPSEAKIRPLGPRDRLPEGRQEFELTLSYSFDQPQDGTVTPRFPLNDQLLYDSDLGTHLWLLFDEGKRRVATGDVFPKPIKLAKGPHVLRLQLRHSDAARLEGLKNTPLVLDRPLGSPITLQAFATRTAAVAGGPALDQQAIEVGQRLALYVKPPAAGQIPAPAAPGDLLLGTIDYTRADAQQPGSGARPGGFPLRFVVPSRGKPVDKAAAPAAPKDLWEFRLAQLQALPDPASKEFDTLCAELLKDHRDPTPVLVARLHGLDTEAEREDRLDRIVAAADAVIVRIDTTKLAAALGVKPDPEDPKSVAEHDKMTRERDTLVDALYRKGRALGYRELPEVLAKRPMKDKDKAAHGKAFEANFGELRRWVDTTEPSYYLLHVRRERRLGRRGRALEALNKHLPAQPHNPEHAAKRIELYEELGWKHWAAYEKQWQIIRFPADYEKF